MTYNPPIVPLHALSDYRALLGAAAWDRLHPDIQYRFARENMHKAVTYRGVMRSISMSVAGKLFAQLCRLIGTPLALYAGRRVPVDVKVYPDYRRDGICWDRFYRYPDKKVNRVTSSKCIRADIGMVEVIGCGFGMFLRAYEKNGGICFESTGYFCQLGRRTIRIPELLTPGRTVVSQRALRNKRFLFTLDVTHPWLGNVFHQIGIFQ